MNAIGTGAAMRFLAVAGALVVVGACSSGSGGATDPGTTDVPATTDTVNPGTDTGAEVVVHGCSASNDVKACLGTPVTPPASLSDPNCAVTQSLAGRVFRVKHLFVDEPAGPECGLANTLTCLWNKQIKDDILHIMFRLSTHDLATGAIQFEAGTGVKLTTGADAGKYQFISNPAPQTLDLKLEGCNFNSTKQGLLQLFPDLMTSEIPIIDLEAHGAIPPEGDYIFGGRLTGAICVDAAKLINFKMSADISGCLNFNTFMNDLAVEPDLKNLAGRCATGSDGYQFVGWFDAQLVTNVKEGTVFKDHGTFTCN